MRITIDIDTHKAIKFFGVLVRGVLFMDALPDEVRKTERGFHIIYRGLAITERKMYRLRKLLGDDINRIKLDKSSKKRIKQVLFSSKRIKWAKKK